MASKQENQGNRQRLILIAAVVVLIAVIGGVTVLTAVIKRYTPSKETTDYASYYGLESDDELVVIFDSERLEVNGILSDGEVYLSYEQVHDSLNSRFYWDSTEQVLRYTVPEGLISTGLDTTEYLLGKDVQNAEHVIAIMQGEDMYLSLSFVAQYTNIRYQVYENPGRVVISDQFGEVGFTEVKKAAEIREKGGVKSAILTKTEKKDCVTVLEELDNWVKVCTEDGFIGYIQKKALGSEITVLYDTNYQEPEFSHISKDFKINMAWHQVTNQAANGNVESVLASTKGVNVISPTWFSLKDNEGNITSLASSSYVDFCHRQGVEVWGLVGNLDGAEVDVTSILSVTSSRDNLVNTLISEAIRYNLDGINVDLEALEAEAGEGFVQFIRELSIKCENNGIVLSVDNYVPSAYTKFYRRGEQAVFADYIVIMAYDEHYNGSDAGSVASLPFVTAGVEDTLESVPAEQVILGIPFYTRVWQTAVTTDDSGASTETLTSEAVGMSEVESRVAANGVTLQWLDDCGQYYAEYEYNGSTWQIWVEDQNSIEEKLKVMQTNNLAGAAFWRLGYEKNTVWDTITEYLQ